MGALSTATLNALNRIFMRSYDGPMSACRAVLFDLDGTLLDTLEDLADSMNEALAGLGHPPHPTDAYRRFVGDGLETLVERALPAPARSAESIDQGRRAMLEVYGRRWNEKTRPYAGVDLLLDGLFERGVQVAIFSNKPDDFTRLAVEAFLGRWPFQAVRGVGPDTPKKPDPTGALAIAEALGVLPAAWLYCGDTNTDMWTATAAGMKAVGVLWGFRPAEELERAGASALVDRPEAILGLI